MTSATEGKRGTGSGRERFQLINNITIEYDFQKKGVENRKCSQGTGENDSQGLRNDSPFCMRKPVNRYTDDFFTF